MVKKNHYYVLVLGTENSRPKYVTKLESGRYCRWELNGTPLEMSKEIADSVSVGLCLNYTMAHTVVTSYVIDTQLKYYIDGKLEGEENE